MSNLNKYNSTFPLLDAYEELFDFGTCEDQSLEKEFTNMITYKNDQENTTNKLTKLEADFQIIRKKQDYGFITIMTTLLILAILSLYDHEAVAGILAGNTIIAMLKNMFSRK